MRAGDGNKHYFQIQLQILLAKVKLSIMMIFAFFLELVSKELNHFRVIAGLFRQIGVIVVDLSYSALFEDFSL